MLAPRLSRSRPATAQHREFSDEELAAARKMLDDLKSQCHNMLRDAKRIELESDVRRLTTRLDVATDQLARFEKEVLTKMRDVEQVSRTSIAARMLQAKLENLERILHGVADERERLKVELEYPRPRITIVGDPSSPAAVPENPD